MNRELTSAFVRNAAARTSDGAVRDPVLIRPLSASVTEHEDYWALRLQPMRAIDAARAWPDVAPSDTGQTLVLGLSQHVWMESGEALPIAQIVERLNLDVIEAFTPSRIVVDDAVLRQLLSLVTTKTLWLVRIDGEIEASDAAAIERAINAGLSPLDAELRATAALSVQEDRVLDLHAREQEQAMRLLAENFREYLAVWLGLAAEDLAMPVPWMLERLLDISGTITVRPVETDLYPMSVDIGVSTAARGPAGPAVQSLIYDRPSDSWHDEP